MRPSFLVIKPTDESRASVTAVALDTDLKFTAAASTWYRIDLFFLCYAGTTPDFRWNFAVPGRTDGRAYFTGSSTVEPIPLINQRCTVELEPASLVMPGSATSTDRGVLRFRGILLNGGSSQTWGLTWAQGISSVSNVTVFAGSWLATEIVT